MYKYELHCHTGGVSRCATIEPEELVRKYEKAGYSGLVLTDHYSPLTFLPTHYLRPQKAIEHYLSSYHKLKEWCGGSFTVLLGLELRHYGVVNDYLIYGVEEEWLKQQKNMLLWSEKKMCEEMHRQGYLIYQAHPYRPLIYRCNPGYIDGIEIYNGHTGEARNAKARLWAESAGMPVSSGSDTHHITDNPCGGIETMRPIRTNADLLDVLRSQNYKLLCPEDVGQRIIHKAG